MGLADNNKNTCGVIQDLLETVESFTKRKESSVLICGLYDRDGF